MNTNQVILELEKAHGQRGRIREIHRDTGIPFDWLYSVAKGRVKNPQARRIEVLKEYFSPQEQRAA